MEIEPDLLNQKITGNRKRDGGLKGHWGSSGVGLNTLTRAGKVFTIKPGMFLQ